MGKQFRVGVFPSVFAEVEHGLHIGRLAKRRLGFPHRLLLLTRKIIEIALGEWSLQAFKCHVFAAAAPLCCLRSFHFVLDFLGFDLRKHLLIISRPKPTGAPLRQQFRRFLCNILREEVLLTLSDVRYLSRYRALIICGHGLLHIVFVFIGAAKLLGAAS